MLRYILRRLGLGVVTIFGVMVITFLLFRVISGDIAAANLGEKAPEAQKAEWRRTHGYDLPWTVNLHRQLRIADDTGGDRPLRADDPKGSLAVEALSLVLAEPADVKKQPKGRRKEQNVLVGRYVFLLSRDTPIEKLTDAKEMVEKRPAAETRPAKQPKVDDEKATIEYEPRMAFRLTDGESLSVSLAGVKTCGELLDRINKSPDNKGRLKAEITSLSVAGMFNSQFFHHLWNSSTFQSRHLKDNRTLVTIIRQHAPNSLAITVPALGIQWFLAMIISCFVAYYRGSRIDKIGVFLSVLGMCIPFLAFMILGQWLTYSIAPKHFYGLMPRANIYVPIAIMVIAGLGAQVRFYRTIILDETHRDYVRTALAKGVPVIDVLFKHVLRNCMLPILTSLILAIPFLIMGSLLLERYFGIPGLGDLMITSIQDRNEPIMSGLVFLTALIYTVGILVTDICYAVFDPRIRLR